MTSFLRHGWFLMYRDGLALLRQPWYIAITLVQPIIWLLLFGALFERVVDIPGFTADSYMDFLAPGVIVMLAIFSAGWSGMGTIEDLDRGVIDRLLVSPARRGALIAGRVGQSALVIVIQSVILVVLALVVGAEFANEAGVLVMLAVSALLGAAFAALSNGLALLARQEETLIAAVQFVVLPLTFLSAALMPSELLPGWIQDVAAFNPVNWAVEAGREAVSAGADWGYVAQRAGLLTVLLLACATFATRAFRTYQRSV